MENKQSELEFEHKRLEQTISLAEEQLEQARQSNEENRKAIIEAKRDLRENTSHSVANLWSSDGFEALAELSQYANPVTEKIMDYEEVENKIALLENLIKSPYFARIDFKFDDEDEFEKIYIGRTSLVKDSSYDMFIYDWRSPIASVFYRFVIGEAYYDAPSGRITGEVSLKRQYEIKNSELEYFFDAEVHIVDEFLRKMLSQNTSTKMKAIVETIQKEQDIVIRDMENDLMMVQGVAGSGKTSIALHRAAYLMYQGLSEKLSADNILIISPNSLFEQYIGNVLPELGEENIVSLVLEEMMRKILKRGNIQSKNQFLERLITSRKYHKVIKSSIELKTSRQFIEMLDQFIEDLPHKWIELDDFYYEGKLVVTKEVLKKKLLVRKETPLGVKLRQLEDFILETIRGQKNKRLKKSEQIMIKEEMQKFTKLNVFELYRKLIWDKEYFYQLAGDKTLPDCMEDIFVYTQENLNDQMLHYDDAAVLTYLKLKINGAHQYKNIKQVVIDEAQDYYALHYEIFHLLFAGSKFTVLGDMNQTLEKQEDLSLYEQIGKILKKKKSSLVIMDKSFRCTNEILNYSGKFIKQSLEIKSFNREGEEPRVSESFEHKSFISLLVEEVQTCMDKGYKSIGLICKTERNVRFLYEKLKGHMEIHQAKDESATDFNGVFIIPVYMSKGLEFDAVLICDADHKNYHSEEDKKLLYIACTRALHRLNLFSEGKSSTLL